MKYLLPLFLFSVSAMGQNLVPNFSFEQYSSCPTTEDQVEFAIGWSKYSSNNINTTPDYFNSCSSASTMGVPQSLFVYQAERRGCNAYMGLATWSKVSNSREHIGIGLSQPLTVGETYYLSFYTVQDGLFLNGEYFGVPSNNIGIRLSTIEYNPSNPVPINNFAHLRSETIITDTVSWVRISGSLIADSAYTHLILGNFYDDTATDTLYQSCQTCQNSGSYYLVDDVCLSTDFDICNGGVDFIPCNVSVREEEEAGLVKVFPNPFRDILTVSNLKYSYSEVLLYDMLGTLVLHEGIEHYKSVQLDLSFLPTGLYVLKIANSNNEYISKRLTKL